jgi:hypothetical protein
MLGAYQRFRDFNIAFVLGCNIEIFEGEQSPQGSMNAANRQISPPDCGR